MILVRLLVLVPVILLGRGRRTLLGSACGSTFFLSGLGRAGLNVELVFAVGDVLVRLAAFPPSRVGGGEAGMCG